MKQSPLFQSIDKALGLKSGKTQKLDNLLTIPKKDNAKNTPHIDVPSPHAVQQADLLYLPNDDGYKNALVVVDLGSRKLDAEPLKSRSPKEVLKAFETIYSRKILHIPSTMMQVDGGSEFKGVVADYFKRNKVIVRVGRPDRHRQQALVENRNKTIGKFIHKRQLAEELRTGVTSREWIDDLPKIIKPMNKHYERKPNKDEISPSPRCQGDSCNLISIGTKVRVILDAPRNITTDNKKLIGNFRASDMRWENIERTITNILITPNQPPLYVVSGINNAAYTRNQIQVIPEKEKLPKESVQKKYVIEKILERKKIKGKIMFRIKWKGYPLNQSTWEPRTELMKTAPLLIAQYEKKK
jgi:hypothetical protein